MKHEAAQKRLKIVDRYLQQNPDKKEYAGLFMTGSLANCVSEADFDAAWSRCLAMMTEPLQIDGSKLQ